MSWRTIIRHRIGNLPEMQYPKQLCSDRSEKCEVAPSSKSLYSEIISFGRTSELTERRKETFDQREKVTRVVYEFLLT